VVGTHEHADARPRDQLNLYSSRYDRRRRVQLNEADVQTLSVDQPQRFLVRLLTDHQLDVRVLGFECGQKLRHPRTAEGAHAQTGPRYG
jgi:hypothetical protein